MSIAGILGRIAGTIAAEIVWAVETGAKAGMQPVVVYLCSDDPSNMVRAATYNLIGYK
jgi:hypothetical protein